MKKTANSKSKAFPRRKRLRLRNFDYSQPGYTYFLTLCVKDSCALFHNHPLAAETVSILLDVRNHYRFKILAYCLMPDHLHLVMSVGEAGQGVSPMVREFKKLSTRAAWEKGHRGSFWQRSFYDHVVRKDEDLQAICLYVLENPVRAGLVGQAENYPFSGMPDHVPL